MSLVASNPGGEACVCDLNDAFDLTQPTISYDLKVCTTPDRWTAASEALGLLPDPASSADQAQCSDRLHA